MDIYGIDYGNKLAGTTVVCQRSADQQFVFQASTKGKDADAFLLSFFANRPPALLFLDAPLSLPQSFHQPHPEGDFFFRQADRETKAMSPMFLGGLTARAIRLKHQLNDLGHQVAETYPGLHARQLELTDLGYKKKGLADCLAKIQETLPGTVDPKTITSWHHFDSLLACWSAIRFQEGKARSYGDPEEGLIFV
jgi:predicted nuclease with RNAse H fold